MHPFELLNACTSDYMSVYTCIDTSVCLSVKKSERLSISTVIQVLYKQISIDLKSTMHSFEFRGNPHVLNISTDINTLLRYLVYECP